MNMKRTLYVHCCQILSVEYVIAMYYKWTCMSKFFDEHLINLEKLNFYNNFEYSRLVCQLLSTDATELYVSCCQLNFMN